MNPIDAQKGDRLKGNLEVVRRLGKGATAVALLVTRGEQEFVLKVAQSPEHNARLHAEAEILRELRHQHIVAIHDEFEVAGVVALLLDKAGEITLGRRLHDDGPLHLDWLERFGEDLLSTVDWLEQEGDPAPRSQAGQHRHHCHRSRRPAASAVVRLLIGARGGGEHSIGHAALPLAESVRAHTRGPHYSSAISSTEPIAISITRAIRTAMHGPSGTLRQLGSGEPGLVERANPQCGNRWPGNRFGN